MSDANKTKTQLIEELEAVREKVLQFEAVQSAESKRSSLLAEEYQELVETTEVLVTQVDINGVFTFVNQMSERFLGVRPETAKGLLAFDFVHPDDREHTESAFSNWLKAKTPSVSFENRQVSKSGECFHMLWTISSRVDANGNALGFNGIAKNINGRKIAEEELAHSSALVSALAYGLPEHVILLDCDGTIRFINRPLPGGEAEDVIGTNSLSWIPEGFRKCAKECYARVLASRKPCRFLIDYAEGNDVFPERRFFETRVSPVIENGVVVSLVSSSADITSRVELQEQLIQSQKMQAIGTLAGGVAHDMNNVLAVVLGFSSMLERKFLSDDSSLADIRQITAAAERGKSLVANLLGFARKGSYQRQNVDLTKKIEQLVEVLERSLPKQLTIQRDLGKTLPPTLCDPEQIMQALMNVSINASHAVSEKGSIVIRSSMTTVAEEAIAGLKPGDYVRIEVQDDGKGMDATSQRRAFEPFFTTKEVGKGTGLGLSMVYGVMQSHAGMVTVDSELGKGTLVALYIPVCRAREREAEPAVANESPLQGKRVLVIDDESMVRNLVGTMLTVLGVESLTAAGGVLGVERFKEHHASIDLVLLDFSMPDMAGPEVFAAIRAIDPSAQVLICTGHGDAADTENMVRTGALGVMTKPFRIETLDEWLKNSFELVD